jgi:hypothetical protein
MTSKWTMDQGQIEKVLNRHSGCERAVWDDALKALSDHIEGETIFVFAARYNQAISFQTAIRRKIRFVSRSEMMHGLNLKDLIILQGTLHTSQDLQTREEILQILRGRTRIWRIYDW